MAKVKETPKTRWSKEKLDMKDNYWPKYYLVDNEIYVEIKEKGADSVIGVNDLGSPYNPMRAILNGTRISKEEFDKGVAKRRKEFPIVGLKIGRK